MERTVKKVLIADLIKAAENEADAAIREEVAESLGLEPGDVDDDDVENYLSMGGNKGELESSVGLIQWIYDNRLKAYVIHMVVESLNGPRDLIYKVTPEMMREWKDSESMGEYWNTYIRSNKEIEDPNWSCGCQEELCSTELISSYKTRYASIS